MISLLILGLSYSAQVESSMTSRNKSALTGQPCFTERVTDMCSVNHPLFL